MLDVGLFPIPQLHSLFLPDFVSFKRLPDSFSPSVFFPSNLYSSSLLMFFWYTPMEAITPQCAVLHLHFLRSSWRCWLAYRTSDYYLREKERRAKQKKKIDKWNNRGNKYSEKNPAGSAEWWPSAGIRADLVWVFAQICDSNSAQRLHFCFRFSAGVESDADIRRPYIYAYKLRWHGGHRA